MNVKELADRACAGLSPRFGAAAVEWLPDGAVVLEFRTDRLAFLRLADDGGPTAEFFRTLLPDRKALVYEHRPGFFESEAGVELSPVQAERMFACVTDFMEHGGGSVEWLRWRWREYLKDVLARRAEWIRIVAYPEERELVTLFLITGEWTTLRTDRWPKSVKDLERLGLA
jgi:hypothetical protein